MENIVKRKPKNSVLASFCEQRHFLKPTNKWAENQKEPNTNLVNERNGKRRANAQLKTWLEQNNNRHQQTLLAKLIGFTNSGKQEQSEKESCRKIETWIGEVNSNTRHKNPRKR